MSRHDPICEFERVVRSPTTENYRNKNEFTMGQDKDGNKVIGFLLGAFKDGITCTADPTHCKNISRTALDILGFVQAKIYGMKYCFTYIRTFSIPLL